MVLQEWELVVGPTGSSAGAPCPWGGTEGRVPPPRPRLSCPYGLRRPAVHWRRPARGAAGVGARGGPGGLCCVGHLCLWGLRGWWHSITGSHLLTCDCHDQFSGCANSNLITAAPLCHVLVAPNSPSLLCTALASTSSKLEQASTFRCREGRWRLHHISNIAQLQLHSHTRMVQPALRGG